MSSGDEICNSIINQIKGKHKNECKSELKYLSEKFDTVVNISSFYQLSFSKIKMVTIKYVDKINKQKIQFQSKTLSTLFKNLSSNPDISDKTILLLKDIDIQIPIPKDEIIQIFSSISCIPLCCQLKTKPAEGNMAKPKRERIRDKNFLNDDVDFKPYKEVPKSPITKHLSPDQLKPKQKYDQEPERFTPPQAKYDKEQPQTPQANIRQVRRPRIDPELAQLDNPKAKHDQPQTPPTKREEIFRQPLKPLLRRAIKKVNTKAEFSQDLTCVGIQFGRELSISYNNSSPTFLCNQSNGKPRIPCYILIDNSGMLSYLGDISLKNAQNGSNNIIYGIEYLIGKKMSDKDIKELARNLPFKLIPDENNYPLILIDDKTYTISSILTFIFTTINKMYFQTTNHSIGNVVITVPDTFSKSQKEIIKECAKSARLNPLQIIDESMAAYYANKSHIITNGYIIFIYFAEELRASLLYIDGKKVSRIKTISDKSISNDLIAQLIFDDFTSSPQGSQIKQNKRYCDILLEKCREAVIKLNSSPQYESAISDCVDLPKFLRILKSKLELLINERFNDFSDLIESLLIDGVDIEDVNKIIFVSPQEYHGYVKDILQDYYSEKVITIIPEAISTGALNSSSSSSPF